MTNLCYSWRLQSLSKIYRTGQKTSKHEELNNTIKQNLIDMFIILHSVTAEYTLFSSSHGTYKKIF